MKKPDSDLEKEIEQQLLECGWARNGIVSKPMVLSSGVRLIPDFVLLDQLYPLAVLEVKGRSSQLEDAVGKAQQYARAVKAPFAFVTNGQVVLQVSLIGEDTTSRESLPTPTELWSSLIVEGSLNDPRRYPPFSETAVATRLYQALAISRALDAMLDNKKRILISLPTGSGVSYVQFQTAWKLLQSGYCRRMLYLSDRVEIIHQTMRMFSPLSPDVARLTQPEGLDESHRIQFSTPQYFSIPEDAPKLYGWPFDFYDLIFISNMKSVSRWQPILEHFPQATVIAFTDLEEPTSELGSAFGDPVSQYSLRKDLKAADFQPPDGFRAVRLGDIADIQPGIVRTTARSGQQLEDAAASDVYVVTGRDLLPDGTLVVDKLQMISVQDLDILTEGGMVNDRYSLHEGDILIASWLLTGASSKVAIVPKDVPPRTIFTNRITRIRVRPEMANPQDISAFLQSASGRIALSGFALQTRISVSDLSQILVFLPESRAVEERIPEELSDVARAIRQIKEEILPGLEAAEQKNDQPIEQQQNLAIVGDRMRELVATLVPISLDERVINEYPTPIALAYRRFLEARFNIYEQVFRLKDVYEAISFFVYNSVLADAMRRLDPSRYFIQDKGARRAYNGFSMSARMDFVAAVIAIAEANDKRDLFIPELVGSSVVRTAKELQGDLRNRLSHTATATESQQHRVLVEFRPVVEAMLEELGFLTEYRFVRIPSFYYCESQLIRRTEVYRGAVPYPYEQTLDISDLTMVEYNHLVLLDQEEQALDLYPLYQLRATPETRYETHLCFLKQRKAKENILEGESVQGAFEVQLGGYQDFEALQTTLLDEFSPSVSSLPNSS